MCKFFYLIFIFSGIISYSQITVFSNFENGNIELISTNDSNNCLEFKPALVNDSNTTRCWFYFGITGFDNSKLLKFEQQYDNYFTAPNYPVYSFDNKNWNRLLVDSMENSKKYFSGKFNTDTLWLATGYPYTYSKMMNYLDSISLNSIVDTFTLTYSEAGLRVPYLEIKNPNTKIKNMIWIIGRQHAFETTMNYVLEGMMEYFLSDEKFAVKFRKKNIIYLVPMMDVDNVFIGASGRMQTPVDFNRDWSISPYWKAINAVQKKIQQTNQLYKYRVFLDVHSTYPGTIRPLFGMYNEYSINQKGSKNLKKYLKIFYENANFYLYEIKGSPNDYFADVYNMGIRKSDVMVSEFATTIECDWNINNNGNDLTISELKKNGYLIAKSLCEYLTK